MKAAVFDEPGGADSLRWADVPDPGAPGPGEVLIRVAAAGVNNADLLQRRGGYPVPPGASPILGLECSGTVEAVGDGVREVSPGDEVCALLSGGGYAELVRVPAGQVLPLPRGVGLVDGAALPEVACTVHSNLGDRVRRDAAVLVHGGGSGIGTFAIQWAAALGARVLTTAGSRRKLDAAASLGADVLIDYSAQDFVDVVREATEGRGVDVVLDVVGAPYLARNVTALAADGLVVVLGGDLGEAPFALGSLMAKRATLRVTGLRSRPPAQKAAIVAAVGSDVWPLVERQQIRPVVDAVVPMSDAAAAHRLLEGGGTIGKVLLVP